jgi:hypothetical protein
MVGLFTDVCGREFCELSYERFKYHSFGGYPDPPDLATLSSNAPVGSVGMRRIVAMPLYIDHHKNLEGLTAQAVAEDHKKDLEVQHKHGAKALRYWFNEEKGEVYCLFEAPNAEAAEAVHREAHGNVADEIVEVKEGS